jgi:cell division septum initiation protein DivIVA
MDILHLIDRLETLVNESKSVPFMRQILVDEERMIDLIDQMRVSIPEEIKKAQKVIAERERHLAQAKEEAERVRAIARKERDEMLDREVLVQDSHLRAHEVIEAAHLEAQTIRQDADQYVVDALTNLEIELQRLLHQAQNGIARLKAQPETAANTNKQQ